MAYTGRPERACSSAAHWLGPPPSGQQQRLAALGGDFDALVHHHGRGRHYQLEVVLQVQAGIVQKNVLRTSTNVYG
ncbi:MAG: hypothetical protein ACWGO1_15355 [Anaerolineales bacterium]